MMPMLLPGSVLGMGDAEVTQDEFLPWMCPSSDGETDVQNSVSCTGWGQVGGRGHMCPMLGVLRGGGLGESCQRMRSPSCSERMGKDSPSTKQEERLAGQMEWQGQWHRELFGKEKPFHGVTPEV